MQRRRGLRSRDTALCIQQAFGVRQLVISASNIQSIAGNEPQADEADAYCEAHHDGVWKSPRNETHRLVDCRTWLEDN